MRQFFLITMFAFLTMTSTKAFGENWTVNVSGGPNATPFPVAQGAWDAVDLGAVIYDNTPGQEEHTLTATWQWQIIEVWWSPTDNTFNASDPSWERLWQGAQAELSNSFIHCRFVDTSVDHSQYSVRLESQFLDRWGYWWVNVRAIGNVANPVLQRSGDYGTRHYDLPYVRLAIDSKNNRGWLAPLGTYDEWKDQDIANDPTKPGRVIFVNSKDVNKNRIPDYADGYNRDGFEDAANSGDDNTNGEAFAPVKIFIGPNINLDTAVLKINYEFDANHPDGKSDPPMDLYIYPFPQENQARDPLTIYAPTGDGRIRLWTHIGATWNKRKGDSMAEGGHWVPPSDTTTYPVRSFPFWNEAERSVTLWVEGIRASEAAGDVRIKVDIDPDGGTFNSIGSDAARVTVLKADILADTDHDGTIGESDELGKDMFWTIKGAIVMNNCDSDRPPIGDEHHDNKNNENGSVQADEHDLAKINLARLLLLPPGWMVRAKVSIAGVSNADKLRVFDGQTGADGSKTRVAKIGPGKGSSYIIPDLTTADLVYAAEAMEYPSKTFAGLVDVTLEIWDGTPEAEGKSCIGQDTICLKVAPYLMLGHENAVEKVYAADTYPNFTGKNNHNIGLYRAIQDAGLNGDTDLVTYPTAQNCYGYWYVDNNNNNVWIPDLWPQDAFDIGYSAPPVGNPVHVAASLPRWEGLHYYATKELLSANFGQFYTPDADGDFVGDYGGNIEIVPPRGALNQGMIFIGDKNVQRYDIGWYTEFPDHHRDFDPSLAYHPDVADFLAIQGVQGQVDNGVITQAGNNESEGGGWLTDLSKHWDDERKLHWVENDGIVDDPVLGPARNTWVRSWVTITGGKGKGQVRMVTGYTDHTLMVDQAWDDEQTPDQSSLYHVSSIVMLHTDWLDVGHLDSVIKFTPDGNVLAGDTNRGIKLMADLLAKKSAANVSSATPFSVTCDNAGWTVDEWANGLVYVDGGEGKGQLRRILSNTDDTLYIYETHEENGSYYEKGMLWDPNHPPVGPQTPPSTIVQSHVLIYALQDLGQADGSGNTVNKIQQSTLVHKNWATNEWQGGFVEITAGAMCGQVRQISSNTDEQITGSRNWTPETDEGTSTGGAEHSVTDTTKAWTQDQWVGATVFINTAPPQMRTVTHNTGDTLTLDDPVLDPIPDADLHYIVWLESPNATSKYVVTNRDAYRAMFIETGGAEECGTPSAMVAYDRIVDSTKTFLAGDNWEQGGVVLIYHQTGEVEWAKVQTWINASTLELDRPLNVAPSPTDKYVLVKPSLYWLNSLPAVTTVWEVLTETTNLRWYGEWGWPKGDCLLTKCQQTYQFVWGTDPTTGGPGLLERMANAGALDVKNVIPVPDLMGYTRYYDEDDDYWYLTKSLPETFGGFYPAAFPPNGFVPTDADNFMPCMANMLIVNRSSTHQPLVGKPIVGAVPYPHGPRFNGVDIFQADLDARLGNIMKVDYVDDWNGYHVRQGGVHCGTTEKRAIPTAGHWWDNW
jgi:hypothetical protein